MMACQPKLILGAETDEASAWFARVWQAEDGLPENNVTGVLQTKEGYLWVSTHIGLSRFDGVAFRLIPVPVSASGGNPMIRAITCSGGDHLWLAMEGGFLAEVSSGISRVFTSSNGLPSIRPLSVACDREGNPWVGYADGSVCCVRKGLVSRYTARDGLAGIGPCVVAADNQGRIWFAKAGRVGCLRENAFSTVANFGDRSLAIALRRAGGLWVCADMEVGIIGEEGTQSTVRKLDAQRPGVAANIMLEDRSGALWIGTRAGGLFRLKDNTVERVETSHSDILSLAEDRENNIWAGTGGGGLNRIRARVIEVSGAGNGLPSETVRSLCEDDSGKIWVTTGNGGLAWFEAGAWRALGTNEGWLGARATCVAASTKGAVWIGTYRGGLYRWAEGAFSVLRRSDGLAGETVRALMEDRRGGLWIGMESSNSLQVLRGGRLTSFNLPPGGRTIRAMAEDRDGHMWFGTTAGMLLRSEGERLVDETPNTLAAPKPIRTMLAAPDGGVWIGYANAGIGRMRAGKFSQIDLNRGLPDNYICALVPDRDGGLWFSTDHGISQVRIRKLEEAFDNPQEQVGVVNFGRDEGVANVQGNFGYAPNAFCGRDGRIWLGLRTGVGVVHTARMQPNRIPPPILLERVAVDGRELAVSGQQITIPPGHRRIDFQYTALSFVAPESLRFRYRLEGWDEDWVDAGNRRNISFPRMPAGDYLFHLSVCNHVGAWTETGPMLAFRVPPFAWQTWWFRLGTGACAVGLVALGIRHFERRKYRTRLKSLEQQAAVERERTRIARDIHDELGAGLTQIGLLADLGASEAGEPEKSHSRFSKIGARSREAVSSLDEIVWAANPRNDNLNRLADYLCHLADVVFEGSGLRCRKEVATGLPPVAVRADSRHNLAMCAKEAMTNALKHSAGTTVWLKLDWRDPELTVTVQDDGRGFEVAQSSGQGNGLRNQQFRMKEVGGSVELQSTPGKGTTVKFRLRLSSE